MRRITRKKPVVVLRGGLTEYGRRAAASHTGAMAGAADVFLAAARQTGCLVRTGPDESLDLALCLSALPLPAGRRVAVMTLGGGWGVLAADELARNDLELARWSLASSPSWTSSCPATGAAATPSTSWRPSARTSRATR